ncbi:MAG: hypothetical protein WEA58_02950 [Balneolaceae bacterium]
MLKHLFLILLLIGAWFLWDQRSIKHGPGVLAETHPKIENIRSPTPIETENFTLNPLQQIEGELRVISRKRYWFDELSGIAPYGYIFSWEGMSDEENLRRISPKQDNRSYTLHVSTPPLSIQNMHDKVVLAQAIPANEQILEIMKNIRVGHVVRFAGIITDLEKKDGVVQYHSNIEGRNAKMQGVKFIWIEELSIL